MSDSPQGLIIGCLAGSAVVAAGSLLAQGREPSARQLLGLAFTGTALALAGQYSPDLAGGLATLILTGTVFYYGGPFLDAVTKRTTPK